MAKHFQKGNDSRRNLKGRPKGKQNQSTEIIRKAIGEIINENLPRIRKSIKKMPDEKALLFIEKLLKHYLPAPQDELMRLSDKDLDRIIEKLKDNRQIKILDKKYN